MKVVILAGGYGTRISEESYLKPKPMIEIGERPILWHIMKIYSHYGFNDFIICLGYKGYSIKEYFAHYFMHESDVTFDFRNDNQTSIHYHSAEPWKVTLVNTGLDTMTGGRVKKVKKYINDEPFMLTYGDGVANVNIHDLIRHHKLHGKIATVTSVQPGGRFGALELNTNNEVVGFQEKPKGDGHWINGGFFIMEPDIFDYLDNDETVLEREPLEKLSKKGELSAYKHYDFWQPMDTLRDKNYLEELWKAERAPWKLWI
ncbi:glucose-1-phosphate cytidylyltransferase [Paenibacillus sp. CGMCC 1.16610]|uniref:Glucose-1-phosphate cytidylyltransferase n=1 Tax=Paenibacillus anseongense TaxID=2682845 RepID=A0ABW9U327_9BACL|nr:MULTISPECIES: glucose-1-phosphate cytidylyltransferase [Paenibacillus]MBA2942397.1 glucose-1-phosphate cytidylyltransferase [Paenibacillus sp. CGMCC 1.16610]MVQ34472.1 glucose-1-phosphate cytidylyltransferase [Paenibacillus anseongense]